MSNCWMGVEVEVKHSSVRWWAKRGQMSHLTTLCTAGDATDEQTEHLLRVAASTTTA